MEVVCRLFKLPNDLVHLILGYLDFEYFEYHFYNKPRRQKGMTVIKYPLYRFFVREEDTAGYIVRKPRADTI